jgi:hypothetical protein
MQLRVQAQSVGNGGYGNHTVSSMEYTDNTRAMIFEIDDSNTGYDEIVLDPTHNIEDATYFWAQFVPGTSSNNRVLIMNMAQDATPAPTRNYQITQIQTVIRNFPSTGYTTLWVNKFTKTNWCLTGSSTCKLQAILVPQYDNLTIDNAGELTCHPWDGYTGGVSCFLTRSTLTVNAGAWVNVSQKGFINPNTDGGGGNGGTGGPMVGSNPSNFPENGLNGAFSGPSYRPLGQPVAFLPTNCNSAPSENGGQGGTGGYASLGGLGTAGSTPQTRLNHLSIAPPNRVFLGKAGAQGAGGKGGGGGGSGGNGGNGGNPTFPGADGIAGTGGSNGGDGGNGGRGGGAVIILATNIIVNATSEWVDLSAEDGSNANPISSVLGYGECGSGGDGGDAMCITGGLIGYGAGGVRGQRGNGAGGGQGGSGGSIGSSSIRASNTNQFDKTTQVKKINGAKGLGVAGEPIPALSSTMGADGFPVDPSTCGVSINTCEKNQYTVYDCACNEAYRVLAEMDYAVEYTNFIEFQNTGAFSLSYNDKKNNNTVSMSPGAYNVQYCYYYKNSNLLMAFERVDNNPNTVFRATRGGGANVPVYNEYTYNVFWCKLNMNDLPGCSTIHSDMGVNINLYTAASFIAPNVNILQTLPKTTLYHILNYDYGTVEFNGTTTSPDNKYKYEDFTPYVNEQGKLYEIANSGNDCRKDCLPFEMEWVYPFDFYEGNDGYGSGGSGPGGGYPRLPFMEEIWDVPVAGDDGDDGEDGEGDDDNSDDGSFPPGGDDDEGNLMYVNKVNGASLKFALYPNPSSQLVYLICKTPMSEKVQIQVMDVQGKTILMQENVQLGTQAYPIDIALLQAGMYFVKITDGNGTQVLRLVKE